MINLFFFYFVLSFFSKNYVKESNLEVRRLELEPVLPYGLFKKTNNNNIIILADFLAKKKNQEF
jgi:hypothetical protein